LEEGGGEEEIEDDDNNNNNNNFVSCEYEQPEVNQFPQNLGAASNFWCQKCDMKQVPY